MHDKAVMVSAFAISKPGRGHAQRWDRRDACSARGGTSRGQPSSERIPSRVHDATPGVGLPAGEINVLEW